MLVDKNGAEVSIGDIIFFKRIGTIGTYFHAAIYEGMKDENHSLIHFWSPTGEDFKLADTLSPLKKAIVIRSTFHQVQRGSKFFINNWLDGKKQTFTPEEIISRAIIYLGETGYNLIWNNCQHFCSFIRYGECTSYEVEKYKKMAKRQITRSIARQGSKLACKATKGVIKRAARHAPRLLRIESVTKVVQSSAASTIGRKLLGSVINGAVEVGITSVKLWNKKNKYEKKSLSDQQRSEKLKQSAVKSITRSLCSATGSIIGQALVPVPVVGSLIGGCVGEYFGALISSKCTS